VKVSFFRDGFGRADLITDHAALADALSPDRFVVLPVNSSIRAHQPALFASYTFRIIPHRFEYPPCTCVFSYRVTRIPYMGNPSYPVIV